MKIISDLYHKLNEPRTSTSDSDAELNYYDKQFTLFGTKKNILFVDACLSGKHLYRMILPALGMNGEEVRTAFTGLSKFNQKEQLISIDIPITSKQVIWADFIVIPFTTESLTSEKNNLYNAIKMINEQCKIVFMVDFNFYELSDKHPYKDIFDKKAIERVENNIWFCDICMVSNMPFRDYLKDRLVELYSGRMRNIPTTARITCVPIYLDSEILLSNVDYDPQHPEKINKPSKREPENKKQIDSIIKPAPSENKKQIKVLFEDKKWVLKKGKYPKPIEVYVKKTMAVDETEKWVKKGYDIIIYTQDGNIQKSIIFEHQKNKQNAR